jgi:hypothetical protein
MNMIRGFIAVLIFAFGAYLTAKLFISEFLWLTLIYSVICFIAAYYIWPSKNRGKRNNESGFLDILEMIIEFPFDAMLGILRFLGRLIGGKGEGIDIDF